MLSVSCLCPTFGRPPHYQILVEEAIESFLRQDYKGRMELIVLNDAPNQKLYYAHPNVRIFNWDVRLPTLGAKYNLMIGLSHHNLLLPWEDDDISLPHRISQAVEHIKDSLYWNPHTLFYWEKGALPKRDHGGVCHNASCFRKEAWLKIGGYKNTSGSQDKTFDLDLRNLYSVAPKLKDEEMPSYIYRWGVSPLHLSSYGYSNNENMNQAYTTNQAEKGEFTLNPHWEVDYEKMVLSPPS